MATTWSRPKGEGARARQLVDLVDEILARYIDWREDAAAVPMHTNDGATRRRLKERGGFQHIWRHSSKRIRRQQLRLGRDGLAALGAVLSHQIQPTPSPLEAGQAAESAGAQLELVADATRPPEDAADERSKR